MCKGYIRSYASKVKCLLILILEVSIILLLLLYVSIALQYLINALLYDAHVCHHVRFSYPLRAKQLLMRLRVTLDDIEYVLNAWLYRVYFGECLGEF